MQSTTGARESVTGEPEGMARKMTVNPAGLRSQPRLGFTLDDAAPAPPGPLVSI